MLGLLYDLMSVKFKHVEVDSDKGIPEEEVIANMSDVIEHECPVRGCNHVVAGAKYKYKSMKISYDIFFTALVCLTV